jgi:DNA-binding MarR family transcriptional regulator
MIGPAGREAWEMMMNLLLAGEGRDRVHRACEEVDLSPGALKALLLLSSGPRAMREMAGTFRCDPSYVTGIVDVLERRGAARREPHPADRRVKIVALTETGKVMLARAQDVLRDPPPSFESLSDAEQCQLRDLLVKILSGTATGPKPPSHDADVHAAVGPGEPGSLRPTG